jgi:peptidoglycan-associated lipoprotein
MQLNKLLKGLAIALPLFTLAACSSSSDLTPLAPSPA